MIDGLFDGQLAFAFFDAKAFFDWFINNADYIFVFIFMVIESSFIPFPSELVVPPAAYLAVASPTSDMNVFIIVLVATAGALVGALVNYYLAVWIGRPLVYGFADSRFGHACLIDRAKVNHAEKYFADHGAFSTFVGRLIPAVRQLISIPAGLARMNIIKFITFTTLGAAVWNGILAVLGYWLGKTVKLELLQGKIKEYNTYLSIGGLVLLVAIVAVITYKAMRSKAHSQTTEQKEQ